VKQSWIGLLALLVVVAAGGLVALVLANWERTALHELEVSMVATGRAVAEFAAQGMEDDKLPALQRLAKATQKASDSRIRVLRAPEGLLLADSLGVPADQQQGLSFRPEIRAALRGNYSGYTRLSDENPLSLALFVAVPIQRNPGEILGVAYVSHSTDDILQRLGQLRRDLQKVVMGLALVAFALALYFSRRQRQILESLRVRAGQLNAGDTVESIGKGIDNLVASLQHQVAQLEEEKLKTQLFLEDVAHELKTPITGLSGSVEALVGESDPQRQQRLLGNLERETRRLSQLVGQLVELQNLDYYELRPQKFEARSLLETVVDSYQHEADKKQVQLAIEGPEQLESWGDPDKLLSVVNNLVDNAIRCSPAGSTVTLQLQQHPEDQVQFRVLDEGPGFEHSMVGRRKRSGKPSGLGSSGLGLAIAHQVVKLHGSNLDVQSREGGGTCVGFCLARKGGDANAGE